MVVSVSSVSRDEIRELCVCQRLLQIVGTPNHITTGFPAGTARHIHVSKESQRPCEPIMDVLGEGLVSRGSEGDSTTQKKIWKGFKMA